MQYTNTYQLPLPEAHDAHSRALVHETAQKLEAALVDLSAELDNAAQELQNQILLKTRMVAGSYTGNGAETRTFTLGFTPRLVAVCNDEGTMRDGNYLYGGIAITGHPADGVEITANGFVVKNVSGSNILCNYSSSNYTRTYLYYAFS